jgi:ribonuclease P protein component
MPKQYTLGKEERIKSRKTLDEIFQTGKGFSILPFRVLYIKTEEGLKFAVGASSKNFKNATDRNRIKRIVREAYRLQKKGLKEKLLEKNTGLNIFFIYTAKEILPYKQVYDAVKKIIEKLFKQVNENDSAGA